MITFRAALADLGEGVHRCDRPLTADEVAADFAARYAGIPATSAARPEPAVRYTAVAGARLPVLLGLYGDAARVRGWLPGLPRRIDPESAAKLVTQAVAPVAAADAPCQEVRAGDGLAGLPVLRATPRDAGPYLTTGLVYAEAEGGCAMSVHRMLVLGPDRLVIWMVPGRRLRALHEAAAARGRPLPVSINIGVPPAAMLASALGSRFLPPGVTKPDMAGALARAPLALAPGVSGPVRVLAESEIVIEGFLDGAVADERDVREAGPPGVSLPEFLGYDGTARSGLPVVTVTAVTMRRDAVYQALIGPGREQSVILGLAGAVSTALSVTDPIIRDLHYPAAGGGMLTLVAAVRKDGPDADARLAGIAREVFRRHPFTKLIVFVDEDVDITCAEDVLWAVTTRANLGVDCVTLPGFRPIAMDPAQGADWPRGGGDGRSFIDATVPYRLRDRVVRSFAGVAAAPGEGR